MSHADYSPWISKNEKELVNSFPQKIPLLVCECFFDPQGLIAPIIQRGITTPGGWGGANAAIYGLYKNVPL